MAVLGPGGALAEAGFKGLREHTWSCCGCGSCPGGPSQFPELVQALCVHMGTHVCGSLCV